MVQRTLDHHSQRTSFGGSRTLQHPTRASYVRCPRPSRNHDCRYPTTVLMVSRALSATDFDKQTLKNPYLVHALYLLNIGLNRPCRLRLPPAWSLLALSMAQQDEGVLDDPTLEQATLLRKAKTERERQDRKEERRKLNVVLTNQHEAGTLVDVTEE